MIGKIIDGVTDRLEKKLIKKENGIPIFYVVYDPTKQEPNVTYYSLHPELHQNKLIKDLSRQLAGAVRHYYHNHPDQLEEIKRLIEESKEGLR